MSFTETSSVSAGKNFEIVRDNYRQGRVSITQLIDAQQASVQAKLAFALSVYEYIIAQLQLELSVGFLSPLYSDEELREYEERFEQFLLDQ